MRSILAALPLTLLILIVGAAEAQTGANVLVVANEALDASVEIAERYVYRREVPADNLLKIRTSVADQITREEFQRDIQGPIARWLARHRAQDRILYIVLTKGIPLRIAGTGSRNGTVASVDSELSLLYREMTGTRTIPQGPLNNPYFLADSPPEKATRFSHAAYDIYLVTRLDGFTVADALALLERGSQPVRTGYVVLDQRIALADQANEWLAAAARRLEAQGHGDQVLLDSTSRVLRDVDGVMGYYSWGSNDPAITARRPSVGFAPGALAAMFVSTDARTFEEPPAEWSPGRWEVRQSYFAGSPQSLSGDLVRAGATGVGGYVAEPFLDGTIRPDILFPAYFAGFNLAEAFYLALPSLSWQAVIIGDPLCRPFEGAPLADGDLNPPLDEDTELPTHFSARRLASSGLRLEVPRAAKLVLRAESRLSREDKAGAREALEQAVVLDDDMNGAWRALALLHDELGEYAKALAVYRKLVDRNVKDPMILNNLAYGLAIREGKPEEALPYAERAALLGPRSPFIADTLGWVKHLLGDHPGAVRHVEFALKGAPENPEIQLHAAVIFAAVGRLEDASAALKAAENLDPALRETDEFRLTQEKLRRK